MKDSFGQIHFEFKDWKEMLKVWKENIPLYGSDICLILSTNSYTSGYWIQDKMDEIEKSNLQEGFEYCYEGDEVMKLEKRIIAEHELAKFEKRSPHLIV